MINPCRARNVINLILLAGLIGAPGCASKRPAIPEALLAETTTIEWLCDLQIRMWNFRYPERAGSAIPAEEQ